MVSYHPIALQGNNKLREAADMLNMSPFGMMLRQPAPPQMMGNHPASYSIDAILGISRHHRNFNASSHDRGFAENSDLSPLGGPHREGSPDDGLSQSPPHGKYPLMTNIATTTKKVKYINK